jgi:hypothetical protein
VLGSPIRDTEWLLICVWRTDLTVVHIVSPGLLHPLWVKCRSRTPYLISVLMSSLYLTIKEVVLTRIFYAIVVYIFFFIIITFIFDSSRYKARSMNAESLIQVYR